MTLKPFSWIILIFLLFGHTLKASAQIWKYLGKYDPKEVLSYEKTLNKEACSVRRHSEMYGGEKSTYDARTYCIRSLGGTRSDIIISAIDHGHDLSIEGPGNTILIHDISGLEKIHFLRPELLEVVYSPRGGSDQGFEYVLILAVDKNRLCFVSEFMTVNEYTIPDEYHLYEVRLKLRGQTLRNCELTANVRTVLKAGVDTSKNYEHKSVYVLRYDETRKIFYNKIEHLNAAFRMDSSGARPRLLTGDYPIVCLGLDQVYYYIDDMWYALFKDDEGKKTLLLKVH